MMTAIVRLAQGEQEPNFSPPRKATLVTLVGLLQRDGIELKTEGAQGRTILDCQATP